MLKTTILVTCYFVVYKPTTFVVAIRYFSQVGDLMDYLRSDRSWTHKMVRMLMELHTSNETTIG